MAESPTTHFRNKGNTSLHRSLDYLQQCFATLTPPPTEIGQLRLIVCRRGPGVHEALDHVRLTPQEGVPGDEWNRRTPQHPDGQLTVIRYDIAQLISNGQSLTTSGDNLVVELDVSAANLPVGTRLRVGEALLEMTAKAHNGCQKFAGRFGQNALRFVQTPATRHHNLRGVYWKVIEAGDVRAGAPIQVLSRTGRS